MEAKDLQEMMKPLIEDCRKKKKKLQMSVVIERTTMECARKEEELTTER